MEDTKNWTSEQWREYQRIKDLPESQDVASLYTGIEDGRRNALRKYQDKLAKETPDLYSDLCNKDERAVYEPFLNQECLAYEQERDKRIAAGTWPAKELAAAVAEAAGDNEYNDAEPEIRTFLLGVAWARNNENQ